MVDLSLKYLNSSFELNNSHWTEIIENLSDVCQLRINGSMFTGTETDKVLKLKIRKLKNEQIFNFLLKSHHNILSFVFMILGKKIKYTVKISYTVYRFCKSNLNFKSSCQLVQQKMANILIFQKDTNYMYQIYYFFSYRTFPSGWKESSHFLLALLVYQVQIFLYILTDIIFQYLFVVTFM